jgi:hypothetical protein
MATTKTSRITKKIDCGTCGKEYSPMCDYLQGRCPHHAALIDVSLVKTKFLNLFNFFKGIK